VAPTELPHTLRAVDTRAHGRDSSRAAALPRGHGCDGFLASSTESTPGLSTGQELQAGGCRVTPQRSVYRPLPENSKTLNPIQKESQKNTGFFWLNEEVRDYHS
jgi:hypothetical protein